ncbi:MAG: hypothetical protein ACLP50_20095 [Solirubrobacteraceae bacterium]
MEVVGTQSGIRRRAVPTAPRQFGHRTELPIGQPLRDVLGLQIGDGTAQIMKLNIARERVGGALSP